MSRIFPTTQKAHLYDQSEGKNITYTTEIKSLIDVSLFYTFSIRFNV